MNKIDFLPERIKARRARIRRLIRQGWLLGLCAAALTALAFVRQTGVAQARTELQLLNERTANVRLQLSKRSNLEKQLAQLMIKKRISERLGSRIDTLEVLAELERLLPESMALTTLTLEPVQVQVPVKDARNRTSMAQPAEAVPVREREVNRVRLVLTGLAPTDVDVANFIGQFAACPLFEDVNMGYARTIVYRGRSAREFQASCYVAK